jgi:hypothetical protein
MIMPVIFWKNWSRTMSEPVRQENQEAIELLDEWFAEPDDMGEEFWKRYEAELLEIRL